GPPQNVVDALCAAVTRPAAHGYAAPLGLPELREALAERYRSLYGVELDPEREVAVVPGTKTAVAELTLVLADGGRKVVRPDPGYPDCLSSAALAGARVERVRLDAADSYAPDFASLPRDAAALYLNYPSNPCAGLRAARCLRRGRPLGRGDRDGGGPRPGVRRPRLRRPRAAQLPHRAGLEGGRRRAPLDVEDVRHGGL